MAAAFRAIAEDIGDGVRSVVDLYLECTAEAMDRLSAAIAAQSADEGVRAAHTCAGSSQLCGVRHLGTLFERIEEAARGGRFDLASALCRQAQAEFAAVRAVLLDVGGRETRR
jgi:HPt (histidine-containing phosphotransfer) domain-containing protein